MVKFNFVDTIHQGITTLKGVMNPADALRSFQQKVDPYRTADTFNRMRKGQPTHLVRKARQGRKIAKR